MASSVALNRGWKKAARAVAQMAVAGSATVLVTAIAGGLSPATGGLVLAFWGVVVTFLHNYLETAGKIPVLLPTPGLVPLVRDVAEPVLAPVLATAEAGVAVTGEVVGSVTDLTGAVAGTVTGAVTKPLENLVGGIHNKPEAADPPPPEAPKGVGE